MTQHQTMELQDLVVRFEVEEARMLCIFHK